VPKTSNSKIGQMTEDKEDLNVISVSVNPDMNEFIANAIKHTIP
jgi:hypothetical protein